jgi:polysaccharide biosynthesis/export protein
MPASCPRRLIRAVCPSIVILSVFFTGCQSQPLVPPDSKLPVELQKASLPPYVIEPPDILMLDAIRVIPKPPYHIEPLDWLLIQVQGVPETEPIQGMYVVAPDGRINIGITYGSVKVVGLTLEEAKTAIENHLKGLGLKKPEALVTIAQSRALQQIRGEHLVRPDGTVSLGLYGSVYVTGMTVPEAKTAIEEHLKQYLEHPEISLDILAFNSKVFYVITDGGGYGQQVIRLPVTGNETVLDALAQINGLPYQSSKRHIWVARPSPAHPCTEGDQILQVDWNAITKCGQTATNYQIMPGDRIFVQADALVTANNWINKIASPIERVLGVTLLGAETVFTFQNKGLGNGGGGVP